MNILGIIPARSGSKGITNKNIIKIKNQNLISYSIKSAKKSRLLTDKIVSTDSIKIAKISKKELIDVPFLRPKKLASDRSLIVDTLLYCLKKMEKLKKKKYEYVVLIQPTAPNRKKNEIDQCIKKIINTNSDSLISLTEVDEPHPFKLKIIKNGIVKNFLKKGKNNYPRQLLPKVYKPSGNIYIFKRKFLIKKDLIGKKQTFHLVKQKDFVNIDNSDDLFLAKFKLKNEI
jgi:CMP-N-acetylneuraminic acid synthetase|tara:strand:- start:756 stop:1445 length:690 start_codon:yes stop_codon:yes gene_type:complete